MEKKHFTNLAHISLCERILNKLNLNYGSNGAKQISLKSQKTIALGEKSLQDMMQLIHGNKELLINALEQGTIYAQPIAHPNHLIASIVFKDLNDKIFIIVNDSNGEYGINVKESFNQAELDKNPNVTLIDLSARTQYDTPECQIIAIATMKKFADQIAEKLLVQQHGQNFVDDEFKQNLITSLKTTFNNANNKNNSEILMELVPNIDENIKTILTRDNHETFQHMVLDKLFRSYGNLRKNKILLKVKKLSEMRSHLYDILINNDFTQILCKDSKEYQNIWKQFLTLAMQFLTEVSDTSLEEYQKINQSLLNITFVKSSVDNPLIIIKNSAGDMINYINIMIDKIVTLGKEISEKLCDFLLYKTLQEKIEILQDVMSSTDNKSDLIKNTLQNIIGSVKKYPKLLQFYEQVMNKDGFDILHHTNALSKEEFQQLMKLPEEIVIEKSPNVISPMLDVITIPESILQYLGQQFQKTSETNNELNVENNSKTFDINLDSITTSENNSQEILGEDVFTNDDLISNN